MTALTSKVWSNRISQAHSPVSDTFAESTMPPSLRAAAIGSPPVGVVSRDWLTTTTAHFPSGSFRVRLKNDRAGSVEVREVRCAFAGGACDHLTDRSGHRSVPGRPVAERPYLQGKHRPFGTGPWGNGRTGRS